jgi:2-polyprenyl-6-methoxyphenol hydroxylase-like FAD-dependent oxidoreductase
MNTRCCIAGGGPAGMMLGVLLARAGIDVVVLEKHADFLRDFRGDTVHPSTLEVIHELGWLDDLLARPHTEVRELGGQVAGRSVMLADFRHLPVRCPFIALMPQWDFLDFLVEHGRRYPAFHVEMQAEVVDLLHDNERVAGVIAQTPRGPLEVRADVTIGADGRQSIVRARARLPVEAYGVPIDVLWMRLPRRPDDPGQIFGYLTAGHVFVMLYRGDYWQCAFVIPKGGYDEQKRLGLASLRETIVGMVPWLADRIQVLQDWDQIKLLTVLVDRLREWSQPGLLCIGDAAHAMSPIGGVGINLAIQDAVAAANLLAGPLQRGVPSAENLRAVQRRREFPTRATQRLQLAVQNRFIGRALTSRAIAVPWPVRLINAWPPLRRIPARLVGLGFRAEHVRTKEVGPYGIGKLEIKS